MTTPSRRAVSRLVAPYPRDGAPVHERTTQTHLAKRLAGLLDADFVPERPEATDLAVYYVPAETLVGEQPARALGIRSIDDLFGGVVPHAFVGTKAITHGLAPGQARRPAGWNADLAQRLDGSVLRGYTAFSREDARRGGADLLAQGPVRLKPVHAMAGRGQVRLETRQELDDALQAMADTGFEDGLVIEEDLREVSTYSVGIVEVGGRTITYVGTQSLTRDNDGHEVYGGSVLRVAPGGFDVLLSLRLQDIERRAVDLARRYDAEALAGYPTIIASRRNYDIAQGLDARDRPRCGVLEQSWRLGGASVAEVAALEAFRADADLKWICAGTEERYGADAPPVPQGYTVVFDDADDTVGQLRKSGGIIEHGHA